jgi:recombination protein RecA
VEKRGSFYSYGETRLGQGRENVKAFLRDNPDMALEIENQIREACGLPLPVTSKSDKGDNSPPPAESPLELDLTEAAA